MGCYGERGNASVLRESGTEPPAGVQGAESPPPEADGILVLEHTFLRCREACSGSRSDRSDQTEAYI